MSIVEMALIFSPALIPYIILLLSNKSKHFIAGLLSGIYLLIIIWLFVSIFDNLWYADHGAVFRRNDLLKITFFSLIVSAPFIMGAKTIDDVGVKTVYVILFSSTFYTTMGVIIQDIINPTASYKLLWITLYTVFATLVLILTPKIELGSESLEEGREVN